MANENILIIDDDEELRENLVEILQDNHLTPTACGSAREALKLVEDNTPELIIMDNMMPGMTGMTLLPLIKRNYPAIKIIMITAFSTVDNAVEAMKVGADDYIAKPFKRDELIMAVKRNIEAANFTRCVLKKGMDDALFCLSNPLRRQVLLLLAEKQTMRFMDIIRGLDIEDHTKVNFHLKTLKGNDLITQNKNKSYTLTAHGEKIIDCLLLLSHRLAL